MQNSHFLLHHLSATFSVITGNLSRSKATIHFGLLLCFLSFPSSPTCFSILLLPLTYPSCCPTQTFEFLRWLPVWRERQLRWCACSALALQGRLCWPDSTLTRCSCETAMSAFQISTRSSTRMGVFPAARQEMALAVSPQSAVHLKVLHSSTSRFFHWGKHVYC